MPAAPFGIGASPIPRRKRPGKIPPGPAGGPTGSRSPDMQEFLPGVAPAAVIEQAGHGRGLRVSLFQARRPAPQRTPQRRVSNTIRNFRIRTYSLWAGKYTNFAHKNIPFADNSKYGPFYISFEKYKDINAVFRYKSLT